ncbi:HAD-IB family phosphatase [Dehalogenimonas etheniformans]|uniref:2,3-diketo-5-methylthio-1-phosphopentane phosphatase n=1 Tax=Dehalogenimonas etheniformans TaxID=1536648 RepID=A0A2P5P9L6_9CHLR|nr:HAD-IB family phosphatase [Dehalogenimonas etheniformans]PPD58965.1 2,3-diketo-5-methylthio-1-phosphopentane phosphatase [Dehalogenimonas etheniformans]QNT76269.1 HAD-IB family phosphatase [Dehalogenimonas etheniformans]
MIKTLLQCDFDGTLTEEDVSFLILERFAESDWKSILRDYQEGNIPVGQFNYRAFNLVKQDRAALEKLVREEARLRPGVHELIEHCRSNHIELRVVSNGLDFYVRTLLGHNGFGQVEVAAARTLFTPEGLDARYFDLNGKELLDEFKAYHTRRFIEQGYRVLYAGNGPSDIPASRLAEHTFATQSLLEYYRREALPHTPFHDLHDIVAGLKNLV